MYTFEVPGKILREYKGTGTLIAPNDVHLEGGLEFLQLVDGRLIGKFYFKDRAPDLPWTTERQFLHYALEGVTIQGWDVWSDTLRMIRRIHGTAGDEIVFHARDIEVTLFELADDSGDTGTYLARFGLVNLQFSGNRIDLDVNGYKIGINRVDEYDSIMESLKTHKGVGVTSEALVVLDTSEVTDHLLSTMQDVCILLSFASGTRVNWVCYDVLIPPTLPARSYLFGDAVTMPFSTRRLIPPSTHKVAQLVNDTFDTYGEKKEEYELYSVLTMYLVAKIPHLFIGSRIMLISQALEALKSSITPEYMLDEAKLDERIDALIEGTRSVWLEVFPTLGEAEKESILAAITSRERIKGLTRLSYPRGLKNIVESLGLPHARKKELKGRVGKLVAARNVLTHDALAYEKKGAEAHQDFTGFVNLMDIILLKILEYKGEYLDCNNDYAKKTLDIELG